MLLQSSRVIFVSTALDRGTFLGCQHGHYLALSLLHSPLGVHSICINYILTSPWHLVN